MASLQITYAPTGENITIGAGITPQFTAGLGEIDPIVLTTPSGVLPAEGVYGGGSNNYTIGSGIGGYFVRFFSDIHGVLKTKFAMDDATALAAARATITAQLVADAGAITIGSDGALVTPS